MEELIISKAKELFFSYGLKSVSMDDISRDAAISKKTIYKSFDDKNQLVERLVNDFLTCFTEDLQRCTQEAKDPVEEVIRFAQTSLKLVRQISPNFFFELRKFCPSVWKMIEQHTDNVVAPLITHNLQKGIADGLYRDDIDIAFTTALRLQQVLYVMDVRNHADKAQQSGKLMMQLTDFYLHAIVTSRGKKLINKYSIEYNEKQFSN